MRRFRDEPIPEDVWVAILEAGRLAPSTVNLQTWSFADFTGVQWRDFFGRGIPFDAPRALIVMADSHRARRVIEDFPQAPLCEHTVGVMNASLAAMNMCLSAEALGLGSVMLSETGRTGFYDAAYLAEKMALPAGVVPILTLAFGYPRSARPAMPPKLPIEAVCFTGRYRETPAADLEDWYHQMRAGYMAGHRGEDFSARIEHYKRRIGEAERGLRQRVLPEEE